MSSFAGSFSSNDQLSCGNNPSASLEHGGDVQSAETHPNVEARNLGEALAVVEIKTNLDYAHSLRSILNVVDKWVLWHNFDIPLSVRHHFPGMDSGAIPDPGFGDVCVYERMLLAGLCFPFLTPTTSTSMHSSSMSRELGNHPPLRPCWKVRGFLGNRSPLRMNVSVLLAYLPLNC
jgi:hypothetical protein